jgi:antagonist of KipI
MSLNVIKAGLFDTIQDTGRTGAGHLGINPSGAMDPYAARMANALIGKELNEAVLEMHYPAPHLLFREPSLICLTGADFKPVLENRDLPLNHPVLVPKGAILHFEKLVSGARCYLSTWQGFDLKKWMDSYSTNTKAGAGGWSGRTLQTGDQLPLNRSFLPGCLQVKEPHILPWTAAPDKEEAEGQLAFIPGREWNWLTPESQEAFLSTDFQITPEADRMGYRLSGPVLTVSHQEQLVSSAVGFGTIQLLPSGQPVVLMADHQTTGGYPRIGHLISAHLSRLAQKKTYEQVRFYIADMALAQKTQMEKHKNLRLLQYACKMKMEKLLHEYR